MYPRSRLLNAKDGSETPLQHGKRHASARSGDG
jgi:hypothetical protein